MWLQSLFLQVTMTRKNRSGGSATTLGASALSEAWKNAAMRVIARSSSSRFLHRGNEVDKHNNDKIDTNTAGPHMDAMTKQKQFVRVAEETEIGNGIYFIQWNGRDPIETVLSVWLKHSDFSQSSRGDRNSCVNDTNVKKHKALAPHNLYRIALVRDCYSSASVHSNNNNNNNSTSKHFPRHLPFAWNPVLSRGSATHDNNNNNNNNTESDYYSSSSPSSPSLTESIISFPLLRNRPVLIESSFLQNNVHLVDEFIGIVSTNSNDNDDNDENNNNKDSLHTETNVTFVRSGSGSGSGGEELMSYLNRSGYNVRIIDNKKDSINSVDYKNSNNNTTATNNNAFQNKQSARDILMVAPTAFMSNSETAQDNKFMAEAKQDSTSSNNTDNTSLLSSVLSEHLSLYHSLKKVGVNVHLFNHTLQDDTPDAVFPNNWFSTRRSLVMRSQEQSELEKEQNQSPRNEVYKSNREKVNKTMILSDNDSSNFCIEGVDQISRLVLYPMLCESRQRERQRQDILHYLQSQLQRYGETHDIELENKNDIGSRTDSTSSAMIRALEGTGSLVLDHLNGIAYAALSERTNEDLLREWSSKAYDGYKVVTFSSSDRNNVPIYHTNVVMAIGSGFAVVCTDTIRDKQEKKRVVESLTKGNVDGDFGKGKHVRELIEITIEQMEDFCGNILEVESSFDSSGNTTTNNNQLYIVMSSRAYKSFTAQQIEALTRRGEVIIHVPFDKIENVGGGGVRCAMAELF